MAKLPDSPCWSLQSNRAVLRLPQFEAVVDLTKPSDGLNDLSFSGQSIDGFVVGISPANKPIDTADELSDIFVRGNDLVATFAQTKQRPFALQVYWRVNQVGGGQFGEGHAGAPVVQIDTILSLQTCLLESFPNIGVCSQFSNATAWQLCDGTLGSALNGSAENSADESLNGVLLRCEDANWSYAERVQPEDLGEFKIDATETGIGLTHQLGGQFLEKGVIRRLRMRGLLLPREQDVDLATNYLASLETEEPPLTV